MIKRVSITNHRNQVTVVDLMDPAVSSGFIIKDITGLGPVNAALATSDFATADGVHFSSARQSKRNIVFSMYPVYNNVSLETNRQKMYLTFPVKRQIGLKFESENRIVSCDGIVESLEPDIFSKLETVEVSVICPDPYLYDARDNSDQETSFSGVVPLFSFPFENESLSDSLIEFGNLQNDTTSSVLYNGEVPIGMIIKIHAIGSVGDITVWNVDSHEEMTISSSMVAAITGGTVSSGDVITIDTRTGKKSAFLTRNGIDYNILNALGKDSDWFKLEYGDNQFAYVCNYPTSLQFAIAHRTAYYGI